MALKIPDAAFSLDMGEFSVALSKGAKKAKKEGMSSDAVKKAVDQAMEQYAVDQPHAAPTVERWRQKGASPRNLPRALHDPSKKDDDGGLLTMFAAAAVGFLIGRSA